MLERVLPYIEEFLGAVGVADQVIPSRAAAEHEEAGDQTEALWLYRVSWCRCVDLKRKEGARRRPRLAAAGEEFLEQEDEGPGPPERAGSDEIGNLVRDALDELDSEERALLELRFLCGETLGDISTQLSISLEQTKYRLRRAAVSLRRVLLNQYAALETRER